MAREGRKRGYFPLRSLLRLPEFNLCPHDTSLGTWPLLKQDKSQQYVTCKACILASVVEKPLRVQYPATNVKARLQSHGRSLEHLQSVAELTGCKACVAKASKLQDSRTAPSAVHFFKVVGHLQRGLALRHLVGEGAKEKRARMHFCLAEAMRCIDREHLRRSTSLATHVDGKGARLT